MPSIKSIQRGTITITQPSTSATATITAVDVSKTQLRYLGGSRENVDSSISIIPRIVLTNSTTITATSNVSPFSTLSLSWELTEYN